MTPLDILRIAIFPGFLFIFVIAFFYEWIDRKFAARLQNRVGPFLAGPKGILQPFADFIKLLAKEDIEPEGSKHRLLSMSPVIALAIPLSALFLTPIDSYSPLASFEGDLIVVFFLMTLFAILTMTTAYSSVNRFSTVGGSRVAFQLFSYEIPLTLSIVPAVLLSGSLKIADIAAAQANGGWYILYAPLGFLIFVIAQLAELEMVPFDVPKAETEIVGGWKAELTGRKLGFFRLAEDIEVVLAGSLAAALFMGGPAPFIPATIFPAITLVPGVVWWLIKTILLVLLLSNLRNVFARYRIDQVLSWNWKYILPLALLQVLILVMIPWAAGLLGSV